MSENLCVRCARPAPDGYACQVCGVDRPTAQLQTIADMCPAAREASYGLSRPQSAGGPSGVPGSRVPLDLAAMARVDAVENTLLGWARVISEQRGLDYAPQLGRPNT